jgi:hypothetical protein
MAERKKDVEDVQSESASDEAGETEGNVAKSKYNRGSRWSNEQMDILVKKCLAGYDIIEGNLKEGVLTAKDKKAMWTLITKKVNR